MTLTDTLKKNVRELPWLGAKAATLSHLTRKFSFPGSRDYWEARYAQGGTSGHGSEGILAQFKADVLNSFVQQHGVDSVIEFGCGDGRQLKLAKYPRYLGIDVSKTCLRQAMALFAGDATKSFLRYNPQHFLDSANFLTADLTISLDVIYHLVEDDIYLLHLKHLFTSAHRYVILYTSDDSHRSGASGHTPPHVRHRPVTRDVAERFPEWRLQQKIQNPYPHTGGSGTNTSFADFYIYEAR
ncbi:class I SAM-dependent methyltransferase [Streptomyces sp. NPDC051636]|uniref:class I SAM-dependent methyltransferase n=1 Tax=Streptomyces sp. NPDC051636 TaxID=3365663 RepID=UPI0037A86CF7